MTNLPEQSQWEAGIYQIETTDPVLGGPPNLATKAGLSNIAAQQLANRTLSLKNTTALATRTISAGTGLTGGGNLTANRTFSVDFASDAEMLSGVASDKSVSAKALADLDKYARVIPSNNIDDVASSGLFYGYGASHALATLGDNPFPDLNGQFILRSNKAPTGDDDSYQTQIVQQIKPTDTILRIRTRASSATDWTPWEDVWSGAQAAQNVRDLVVSEYGLGGSPLFVADFDAAGQTGFIQNSVAALNGPTDMSDGRGIHLQEPDGEASQIVVFSSSHLAFRDKDSGVNPFGPWRKVLADSDIRNEYYSNLDAPNEWILGENFKGDTVVGVGNMSANMIRVANFATITLSLDVTGFSIVASDDNAITFSVDFDAIAAAAGWGVTLSTAHIGVAYGKLTGVGWDSPWLSFNCTGSGVDGTIWVGTADTNDMLDQATNATDLEIKIQIQALVE